MSLVLLGDAMPMIDQTQLPYLKAPVYLRLVNTNTKASNYAAAGFHVSNVRAVSGGCADKASEISGTDPRAACKMPLNQYGSTVLWTDAAQAYLAAYQLPTLADRITALRQANAKADMAYAAEGVAPPKDPGPVTVPPDAGVLDNGAEPVTRPPRRTLAAALGVLGALATGVVAYSIHRGQKKHAAAYGY